MPARRRPRKLAGWATVRRGRRNVAAGFVDEDGIFHPLRASFDYSKSRAGEGGRKKKGAKRRRNPPLGKFIKAKAVRIRRAAGRIFVDILK